MSNYPFNDAESYRLFVRAWVHRLHETEDQIIEAKGQNWQHEAAVLSVAVTGLLVIREKMKVQAAGQMKKPREKRKLHEYKDTGMRQHFEAWFKVYEPRIVSDLLELAESYREEATVVTA